MFAANTCNLLQPLSDKTVLQQDSDSQRGEGPSENTLSAAYICKAVPWLKSKASFPLKAGKGEMGGECLRAGTAVTQAQSPAQHSPGLPPKMFLSPHQPQKTTWLCRGNKAKQNPDVAQLGKLKIWFLMYRMWFLMYRNYLIQILEADSQSPQCPLLQVPPPSGWAEMKGITPCQDLRSDAQELPADKGFPSSLNLKSVPKAGNSRTWTHGINQPLGSQDGRILLATSGLAPHGGLSCSIHQPET